MQYPRQCSLYRGSSFSRHFRGLGCNLVFIFTWKCHYLCYSFHIFFRPIKLRGTERLKFLILSIFTLPWRKLCQILMFPWKIMIVEVSEDTLLLKLEFLSKYQLSFQYSLLLKWHCKTSLFKTLILSVTKKNYSISAYTRGHETWHNDVML